MSAIVVCCKGGSNQKAPAKIMKRIYWTIDGKPKAQKRHRDRADGRKYDPSAQDKREFNLQSRQYAPQSPIAGPVLLYVVFYMPVPKGALKRLKGLIGNLDEMHVDFSPRPIVTVHPNTIFKNEQMHIKRPDVDNLLKLVKDSLNGLMWVDDSQVQIGGAFKILSHNPRTEIEIFFEDASQEC